MLSTAAVALLAGQALADTTIDKATTTPLTTGPLETYTTTGTTTTTTTTTTTGTTTTTSNGNPGTGNAGNITIQSAGTIKINTAGQPVITVNSNSFVSNAGMISNTSQSDAAGIRVDMTTNPDPISSSNTANGSNATPIGIDSTGTIDLTGSGTDKHGIWLNGTGTYTGPITLDTGSTTTINGDSSQAVALDAGAVLNGNLTMAGSVSLTQTTATSTTNSSLFGLLMNGTLNGNFQQPSGSSITVSGMDSTGVLLAGNGVNGNVEIGGTLATRGTATPTINSSGTAVNPEGGTALAIGASVTRGVAIFGPGYSGDSSVTAATVTTTGLSPAVDIDPGLDTAVAQTAPLVIGVYTGDGVTPADTNDPGFSFYNRGTISATPVDANNSITAMTLKGSGSGSSGFATLLTGGLFNSGSLSATATTSGTTANANSVTALDIGNNVSLGVAPQGYIKNAASGLDPGDQAALVNSGFAGSGTISAVSSGTRGGVATAIEIEPGATVPSLINTGTISASVTTTDLTLDGLTSTGGHPVIATAIQDLSGTLNSIINTGTISAAATTLNNNLQVTTAIDLSSGVQAVGSGMSIVDQATATTAATINGNIYFGTGDNQTLSLYGDSLSKLATIIGNVTFGGPSKSDLGGDSLTVGAYGVLSGEVTAPAGLNVDVKNYGILLLQNTTTLSATTLDATNFHIENGGSVSLAVSESNAQNGSVDASNSANLDHGANLGIAYASFVPQGSDQFVLIKAPSGKLAVNDIATYATSISTPITPNGSGTMPFLFQSASLQCNGSGPGCIGGSVGGYDELVLKVVPKTAAQLELVPGSYGYQLFNQINTALGIDDTLGASMINGVRNTQQAQAAYNSYAPNVTGGSRAIVISITDQATGAVAARQRMLNMYSKDEGDDTLWGQEFFQMIKDPGQGATQADGTRLKSGYKDHGFGFALGMDSGSPQSGWYGGALTFYEGDVGELYNASNNTGRDSHENEQWFLLSGYSAWRGVGLFFDSHIDVGYGHIDGKRFITLSVPTAISGLTTTTTTTTTATTYTREADNKHAGTMISGGFSTGAMLAYGATTISPQISVDGLLMREEGYTEYNPNASSIGDGFDLQVQPYYGKSLRAFLGASIRHDIDLDAFYLQPELRLGYRYDVFNDPVKLKAAFAYADTSGAAPAAGQQFTVLGPDPAQGNFVLGGAISGTTDTWTMGVSYDFIRGSNGTIDQVGMVNLLGRF
jgi:hypothetical protein